MSRRAVARRKPKPDPVAVEVSRLRADFAWARLWPAFGASFRRR
jgi:hypothetical protein